MPTARAIWPPTSSWPWRIADEVDDLTMARFGAADLVVESKPDLTPVSEADLAAEELIRARLSAARPGDTVSGEEFATTGTGRWRWVLDPIDGTKNYVRGVPVWATLIGLLDGDDAVLGVVSAPALGRRWWAHRGGGCVRHRAGRAGASAARVQRARPRRRQPVHRLARGLDRAGPARSAHRPHRCGLAHPRVRRLLVVHAGGRRRRRPGHRTRAVAVGHGRAGPDRDRGRRHVHRPERAARASSTATPRPATPCCTKPCSNSSAIRTTSAERPARRS